VKSLKSGENGGLWRGVIREIIRIIKIEEITKGNHLNIIN
jgi:hypothetical protein